MFELSSGELFVVAFVTIAVVTALWWPRLGATIAELVVNGRNERKPRSQTPSGGESPNPPGEGGASSESSRG